MRRLLIRPGAIGDLIVSLPALEYLRADYTEVWVAECNVPLIRFAYEGATATSARWRSFPAPSESSPSRAIADRYDSASR